MNDRDFAEAVAINLANNAAAHAGHEAEALDAARRLAYLLATEDDE